MFSHHTSAIASEQLSLFSAGGCGDSKSATNLSPHQSSSPTSRATVARLGLRAGTVKADVSAYLNSRSLGGATREEIACAAGRKESACCGCVADLTKRQLVIESARTRKTTAGSEAGVLVAVEYRNDD